MPRDDLQAIAGVLDDVSSQAVHFMGFADRLPFRGPLGRERRRGEQDGDGNESGSDERETHEVTSQRRRGILSPS